MLTYKVEEGILGKSLVVIDKSFLSDYTDLGIDIDTDIVSITFTITINETDYSVDITDNIDSFRDGNGIEIDASEIYGSNFEDGIYDTTLEIVENSSGSDVTHTTELTVVFYENTKYKILSDIKTTDWKEYFGCYTDKLKTSLRYYNWLLNLEYTINLELYDDAERILTALKTIV